MGKAADEVFQRARERIAQAQREGWERLRLKSTDFNDLEDLPEEISGLTALTALNLWGTQVSDVSALSGLTALTSLDLSFTQVSDVSALSGLTKLTSLNLGETQVSDVSALSGLTALKFLDLSGTGVDRAQLAAVLRGKPGLVPPGSLNALAGPMGCSLQAVQLPSLTPSWL